MSLMSTPSQPCGSFFFCCLVVSSWSIGWVTIQPAKSSTFRRGSEDSPANKPPLVAKGWKITQRKGQGFRAMSLFGTSKSGNLSGTHKQTATFEGDI